MAVIARLVQIRSLDESNPSYMVSLPSPSWVERISPLCFNPTHSRTVALTEKRGRCGIRPWMPPAVQTAEKMTRLLVEDDAFVSDAYQIVLEGGGVRVCNVAVSEPDAFEAILQRRADIALVDIDIESGDSFGVATALIAKDVPVAFVSGHSKSVLPAPFSSLPYLQKPVSRAALLALVEHLENTLDR